VLGRVDLAQGAILDRDLQTGRPKAAGIGEDLGVGDDLLGIVVA
jgi:hypothetical protein